MTPASVPVAILTLTDWRSCLRGRKKRPRGLPNTNLPNILRAIVRTRSSRTLRAKYKGQPNWREVIVNDDHLKSEYIQMAPGTKVGRRFHPDTREWWVIMDGEIRFDIEGQDSFVARKGSMVQVPLQTIYSMEAIGDKPALRFETNIAKAKTLFPQDVKPPEIPGATWIPVMLNRKPHPYGYTNKPHINLYDLEKDPNYKGSRFVHDDRGVSNIIYGYAKNLPPLNENDRGHFHPECAEFWLIMQGPHPLSH